MLLLILLIVLVLEFESRRGEILKKKCQKKKEKRMNRLERLLIAWLDTIRREPTREELKSPRDKNARHKP